ncbi:AmmeMemoRadiSam system protein B [Microvirga sp. KLBC 81]|uniref:AmmeMemoRadiSam system protein B n=1 Tax=Microvirga sp. KLBC 81 TaxID=1862707 RepID=UPI000D51A2F9|nr:AmmeMemoRadiSam system protein B [Microvirga sp. KLBC 81]PVE21649.1 AmmeMemoRadiSam system protein B [Microvirga sp. KLBC 81]
MASGRDQGRVRPAAVAGRFYPGSPHQLRTTVDELLGRARIAPVAAPKAIIVPHAGYIYSGEVAATAFALLRPHADTITRVVPIGPAHYVPFRGLALPTMDVFETPLGIVPLARDAATVLADLAPVVRADAPHEPEHALEVELPFLQSVLRSFELVPLLTGDAAPEEVASVLDRLWGGPETLIVVSSDLSHFHDYEAARRLDAVTADFVERGDWASLGPDNACGYLAIAGLLIEMNRRGLGVQRLALANSGDTAGTRDRVVGYGAWITDAARNAS